MTRVGLLGGTFNPPHRGHIALASAAREALGLARVFFIPALLPPHKELPSAGATPEQRLEMTRIATRSLAWAEVSEVELERGGRSYSSDTVAWFRERLPQDELWFIVGTDMFMTVDRWHEARKLMSEAGLAVMARAEGEVEKLDKKRRELEEGFGARVRIITAPPCPVSSTQLREAAAKGELSRFEEEIAAYIKEKGLYGVNKCKETKY